MSKLTDFIRDFKNSYIYENTLNDPKVDVVMVWMTGSTITGLKDAQSDYDVCVLVKELPKESENIPWKIYSRPCSYFFKYVPQGVKTHCIYNDLSNITNMSTATPLDNIGWAQFKHISDTFILYKNPKYLDLIDSLVTNKDIISTASIYFFILAMYTDLGNCQLSDLIEVQPDVPNKGIAHACWAADVLQKKSVDVSLITRIKRIPFNNLSLQDQTDALIAMNYLDRFVKKYKLPQELIDLQNHLSSYLNPLGDTADESE